jgi:hypothetical protein
MLAYRHVNASWLSAAALCRAHLFGRADALAGIAGLECCGTRDAAAIQDNAPSLADIRIAILHRNHQSALQPRFLAPRLRW